MIQPNDQICPKCGGTLKYYDRVKRMVRTKRGTAYWITLRRFRCTKCLSVHRELTTYIIPYKQYEKEIVKGVLQGCITPCTFEYEDYPSEVTMKRWKSQFLQSLL